MRAIDAAEVESMPPGQSRIAKPAAGPPLALDVPGLLRLQRLAGNQSVSRLLGGSAVQRCGPIPCDCDRGAEPDDGPVAQREVAGDAGQTSSEPAASAEPPITWAQSPDFPPPVELPGDEAARRVNEALDLMEGLTYVRRPPREGMAVASSDSDSPGSTVQTALTVQRAAGASFLAKVHGGAVGSVQVCWDCLSGDASIKGWIWTGVGYDSPFGWIGGYWFGERTWWSGQLGRWFDPGQCAPGCDPQEGSKSEGGWGIAGFPLEVRPGERTRFSRGGVEGGVLLTPHSTCDADLELIALINILGYLGPVGRIVTSAVEGLNRVTRGTPHVELEAGFDISATFHLCRGADRLLTANHADFCGGGFIGAGIGLSHEKTGNHGVV